MSIYWMKQADGLKKIVERSQILLTEKRAYLYRVGGQYFEIGFSLYVTDAHSDWKPYVQQALSLFDEAIKTNNCQIKDRLGYPLNEALMKKQMYLGNWLIGEAPQPELLDSFINQYVEGLWSQPKQPISSFTPMAIGYLLRQDHQRLQELWEMLEKQTPLTKLPLELNFWHQISGLYLDHADEDHNSKQFWLRYGDFTKKLPSPTEMPAQFYLAAAKIVLDNLKIQEDHSTLLRKLSVDPWQK